MASRQGPSSDDATDETRIEETATDSRRLERHQSEEEEETFTFPIIATESAAEGQSEAEAEAPVTERGKKRRTRDMDGAETSTRKRRVAGLLLASDNAAVVDCLRYRVFGARESNRAIIDQVATGTILFLLDTDNIVLHGIYRSDSEVGLNLEPTAFKGSRPAQVRFCVHRECAPLNRTDFIQHIPQNYDVDSRQLRHSVLSQLQVDNLTRAFGFQNTSMERLEGAQQFPQSRESGSDCEKNRVHSVPQSAAALSSPEYLGSPFLLVHAHGFETAAEARSHHVPLYSEPTPRSKSPNLLYDTSLARERLSFDVRQEERFPSPRPSLQSVAQGPRAPAIHQDLPLNPLPVGIGRSPLSRGTSTVLAPGSVDPNQGFRHLAEAPSPSSPPGPTTTAPMTVDAGNFMAVEAQRILREAVNALCAFANEAESQAQLDTTPGA